MDFDNRQLAITIARGRAVLGLVALAFPGLLDSALLGRSASTGVSRAFTRMLGARDVALAIGALTSVKEQTQGPEWLSMGAAADGVDAIVLLLVGGAPKRARLTGVVAAVSAVVAMKVSRDLADDRDRDLATGPAALSH